MTSLKVVKVTLEHLEKALEKAVLEEPVKGRRTVIVKGTDHTLQQLKESIKVYGAFAPETKTKSVKLFIKRRTIMSNFMELMWLDNYIVLRPDNRLKEFRFQIISQAWIGYKRTNKKSVVDINPITGEITVS